MPYDSKLRGFERILTTEVKISDLLQEVTDRDPNPWKNLVGIIPKVNDRERRLADLKSKKDVSGTADLLLESPEGEEVLIEVKLSHDFSSDQMGRYEKSSDGELILLGMEADRALVSGSPRWTFHSLADVFNAWSSSPDREAALLARMAERSLRRWDAAVESVFHPAVGEVKLSELRQKFLVKLVTHRLKHELNQNGWLSLASKSSGSSGLAIIQGFAGLNDDENRSLIAEARWKEGLRTINFRLGVDFTGLDDTRVSRSEAWALAKNLDSAICIKAFISHLQQVRPDLSGLITYSDGGGRSTPDDDAWLPIVKNGLQNEKRGSVKPGFVGDGTLRFEASGSIETGQVDAVDIRILIEEALRHLCSQLPEGYSTPSVADSGS